MMINVIPVSNISLPTLITTAKIIRDEVEQLLTSSANNGVTSDIDNIMKKYGDHFPGYYLYEIGTPGVSVEFRPNSAISSKSVIITTATGSSEAVAEDWESRRAEEPSKLIKKLV